MRPRSFPIARGRTAAIAGTAATLVAALLGWRILTVTVARSLANAGPAASLSWKSDQAEALVALASKDLKTPGPAATATARARALAALTREPLVPYGIEILGQAAIKDGQDAAADALMRQAAMVSKRDLAAEIWIFTHDVTARDLSGAATALDAIMRGHPEIIEDFAAAVAPSLRDPDTAATLVAGLGLKPPWRSLLMGVLVRQHRNPEGLLRLFAGLERSGGLTQQELGAFLGELMANGRYEQAYLYWLQSLPPARLATLGLLYNGHFDYPVSNMAYDWVVAPASGTVIETGTSDKGPTLDIGFLGDGADFKNVTHDLILNPGRYRLTGYVRADHFENQRGLRWRIACLERDGTGSGENALGTSDLVSGDRSWQPFVLAFEVPASGCRAQRLVLELPARTAAERIASGVVSYAGLDILAQ